MYLPSNVRRRVRGFITMAPLTIIQIQIIMLTKIIGIFILISFTFIILFGTFTFIRLHKMGLLIMFMKGKWLSGLLTTGFFGLFLTCGVGLIAQISWAGPILFYTIIFWLIYVWLYNLKTLLNMYAFLTNDKGKSISHYMGRSKFFDTLIHKTIEMSDQGPYQSPEDPAEPHAVRDGSLDVLLNDEETFQELFPIAIRRKMKRKVTGLLIHTAISVLILFLI
ncbi:MAG: hypothetical protein DWQ02_27980 [Bacteroidetes bacterium]|nr:MAG: hypothetical protein DWQ02_27980 [Bacteroidota bacterium]